MHITHRGREDDRMRTTRQGSSRYAAPVPIAISVNIFGLMFLPMPMPAERTAIRPKARPALRE